MKKVIFENGLKAFLVTFCLLLLGAVGISAQGNLLTSVAIVPGISNPPTPSSSLYNVPQGNFVTPQVAQLKLDAEMVILKDQMTCTSCPQPGDPAFAALQVKYKYYRAIRNNLDAGADTRNAIAAGLWIFLENVEMGSVPATTQAQLKADAINLLKI